MMRKKRLLARNKISDQLTQIILLPVTKLSPLVRVIEGLANGLFRAVVSKMEILTQCARNTTVANFATVKKKGGLL